MTAFRYLVIFSCWWFLACQSAKLPRADNPDDFAIQYQVEAAPDWTALFYRKQGWFGADGIFSIPIDGSDPQHGLDTTLLIFSDTYIGEVEGVIPQAGTKMVHNSVAYVTGQEPDRDAIRFYDNSDSSGTPLSIFTPRDTSGGTFFWLGDGFINKDQKDAWYLFAYQIQSTGPNVFDFVEPDVSLLKISDPTSPPFKNYEEIPTPLHINDSILGEGNFGAGVLVNTAWAGAPDADGYVYVYACIGQDKTMVAARVKPKHFDHFDRWQYWGKSGWSRDIGDLSAITNAVSNELSVTPLEDGRYLLVFQVLGISDKVGIRVGLSPVGPFGPIEEIWVTPEYQEGLLPYNAKAHPALSRPGELLISYNTITFDFWNDIQKNAHIYRPRFIRLTLDP